MNRRLSDISTDVAPPPNRPRSLSLLRFTHPADTTFRRRMGNEPVEFPVLDELRQRGVTDYAAMDNRFGAR